MGRCLLLLLMLVTKPALPAEAPVLTQAVPYREGIDAAEYWVSEKLDGVRGYWDGEALRFRSGRPIPAPAWFTAGFPRTPLDGELWLGRRRFDEISGLLRSSDAPDEDWREVRYMLFDLPSSDLHFDERLTALSRLVESAGVPWLRLVPQFKVEDEEELRETLQRVVAAGGEGLMLHRGAARHHDRANGDLMKLKPVYDEQAVVLAHLPGRGRLTGLMGSLLMETDTGVRFRLGSGFTDAQRRHPPPVGSRVRFRHSGLTSRGVPRFARYLGEAEKDEGL